MVGNIQFDLSYATILRYQTRKQRKPRARGHVATCQTLGHMGQLMPTRWTRCGNGHFNVPRNEKGKREKNETGH